MTLDCELYKCFSIFFSILGETGWLDWPRGGYFLNSSSVQFSSVHSVVSDSVTPGTAARQASLSITNSWSLFKLIFIELVMPLNHLILSFPSPPAFNLSQDLFKWVRWPDIEVSTLVSVLPMNIQDWFPLGWTGWISLQSKELTRVFSNTTVQKHQFFGTQLSL